MGAQLVKGIVMCAHIDPNVAMDVSIFKIGGRNTLETSEPKLLEDS